MPEAKKWPRLVEYTAALQNTQVCFGGGELSRCQVQVAARGLPIMYSGSFVAVYKISLDGKELAVRCFIHPVTDQHHRYAELGTFLSGAFLPYFVGFEFLENGIFVRGDRYPLLKMDWINGQRLDRFVSDALGDPERIRILLGEWRELFRTLKNLGIAHNEIQHGNVIIQDNGDIRLVDYDAVYLPSNKGQYSPEAGHRNYQHPLRKAIDFNEDIDNFPALVIFLSLLAVSVNPSLWERFHHDANLILNEKDYKDPVNSECFRALKGSSDDGVRLMAGYLEQYCPRPIEQVPDLETIIAAAEAGQADAPLRVGHTDASVRSGQAPAASSTQVSPPPSAASSPPTPTPASRPPAPRNAGPAQAARGIHPAYGGLLSGTFRPSLATAAVPSAPPAVPAKEPDNEPEAVTADVPEDATTASVAVSASDEASAASIAAPAPEEAAAASTVSVIIAGGSKTDSADVAAILNTAASALAAAAAVGDSGSVETEGKASPVIVVVVNQETTAP